jgi:trans-2,3-dihydro-3-hydroxyanthranilate isomerase
VGLPFLMAEVRDLGALERARPDLRALDDLIAEGLEPAYLHLYLKASDGFDLRTRMFSPLDGPPEDPATGSANCALAALLTHLAPEPSEAFRWRIAQGVEMGRPSVLEARTEKRDGEVRRVWIAGECVMVSEGTLDV